MASPDLEKQGFFAVVFVNREYNGQPDLGSCSNYEYFIYHYKYQIKTAGFH